MDNQTVTSNDRIKTQWTPLMEQYFIDLLLEHLHRGNMVGHTFDKQAWTKMQTLLNAKFGTQYDKDALKSRYAKLWKQFNDVKNILSHIGFSWNASCQMVVANEFAWDAYIKVYPDARCYRTKSVPNFDDLCKIFSYPTADGRYSLSSHDISFNNKVQGLNSDDQMGSIDPSCNERQRIDWTVAMDQFFIELLVDQLDTSNKLKNGFNKKAWANMLAMFNAKFDSQHGKRVLSRRFKKLLKCYCDITHMLETQRFSWDKQQQVLVASDYVWDAYIKKHPCAQWYRSKTLPNYGDLELVFKKKFGNESSNLHKETNYKDVASEVNGGDRKGTYNSSVAERTRTYWTPLMDRCLIDLLMEQVKDKSGQSFIKPAWNDVIKSFNERFKSQHDKCILKNHYKCLRKRFNDVSNLLQHNGFSWDDTRAMVVAKDHVWDAHIQVHPEARSLKVKTLTGYRKLCVIFGKKRSIKRCLCLSRNVDPNVESPMLPTGEQKNGNFSSVHDATSKIEWKESLECYFIDLMIEQVNRGNMTGNSFNDEAWTYMAEAFSSELGVQCDKHFLEDEYFCLMKRHDNINFLFNHNRFAWDEKLQIILAEDNVWNSNIKDNPEPILYKNRSLDRYHALCKIFGNKVSDARFRAQGDLHYMNGKNITSKIDMGGTSSNFHVHSDVEISNQGSEGLKGMDMDGTFGNLAVTDNNKLSYLNEQWQNGADMVELYENLDIISNTKISYQNTERSRALDMDGTSENLVVMGNTGMSYLNKQWQNGADVVDFYENLDIISNSKISYQNIDRPREMDMDGTSRNMIVTSNTGMSYLNEQRQNGTDMVGFYENLDVSRSKISYQATKRPRELDMDGTSRNFVATRNWEILDQDKERANEIDDVVVIGNTVISKHNKKRLSVSQIGPENAGTYF